MSRAPSYLACITALLLPTLGCRGTTEPVSREGCVGPVQITVQTKSTPVFSWSPACGISDFWVVTVPSSPGATEEPMWTFSVPEHTPVGPAIRYGETPVGMTFWTPPRALVRGTAYRVRVMKTVGGDVVVAGGEKEFSH